MSINLSTNCTSKNTDATPETLPDQGYNVTKSVGIAIEASRLVEGILSLHSSASFSPHASSGKMPPVVIDKTIYSNTALSTYARFDPSVTYQFVIKELAIFGTTAKECEEVYKLFLSLGKSEQGRLIQKLMLEDIQLRKLFLFGHPGVRVNGVLGAFAERVVNGSRLDKAIIIPINKPQIAKQLHWSHESGHYLVTNLTKSGATCPLVDLPISVQNDFMNKFKDVQSKLSHNPHPPGTSQWKIHEFLRNHFNRPVTCYAPHKQGREIAAFILELELAMPGFLQKHGLAGLEETLHDILYNERNLPKRVIEKLPQGGLPPNCHRISLSQLNSATNLPMHLNFFKQIGNGIWKACKVVAKHPLSTLPVDIFFDYSLSEEKNLLRSILNGTATWSIGTIINATLLTLCGPQIAITVALGTAAADLAPDFNAMAACMPTPDEVLSTPEGQCLSSTGQIIVRDQIIQANINVKLLGALQNAFRAFNQFRIWEQIKPAVKEFFYPERPEGEEGLELDDCIAAALHPYLYIYGGYSVKSAENDPAGLLPTPESTIQSTVPQFNVTSPQLEWQTTIDAETQITTVKTNLEIPKRDLESVNELTNTVALDLPDLFPAEDVSTPEINVGAISNAPLFIDLHSGPIKTKEKPSFNELSKITDIRIGAGIGGGAGLVISLASGAEVSLAATQTGVTVGVSVAFGKGFAVALATGCLYAAPIAAVLVCVQLAFRAHQKKTIKHLKKDNKDSIKEMGKVSDTLKICTDFFEKFQKGEIDQQGFITKVNEVSRLLNRSSSHMVKRGRYAENHKGSSLEYFLQKTRLEQIDLDLRAMARDAVIKKEIDTTFAPGLKEKSLEDLYADLQLLAGKKIVFPHDKHKQDAIKTEISLRIQGDGDLEALSRVGELVNKPKAISLEPTEVAKPGHLSTHKFQGSSSSKERRRDRVKHWADQLAIEYANFCKAAQNYTNIEELQAAADRVLAQIARADGNHDVNLARYSIGNGKKAQDYYKDFISDISKSVETTMVRAKAAEKGEVCEELMPLFSQDELNVLKFNTALKAFDRATEVLNDDSMNASQKSKAFEELIAAAKILDELTHLVEKPEEIKQVINPVLTIASEHPTYNSYRLELDRLETIKNHIEALQALSPEPKEKASDNAQTVETLDNGQTEEALDSGQTVETKKKSQADLRKELGIAHTHAKSLLAMDITVKEIEKLTGKTEDAEKLREQIIESAKAICCAFYDDKTHYLYEPGARLILHILRDFERFEGYENWKLPVRALSSLHAFAPAILPSGMVLLDACLHGEGAVVIEGLVAKASNACTKAIDAIRDPVQVWQKADSLHKKSNVLQNVNAAIQIAAGAVTAGTTQIFGDNQTVKRVNAGIKFTASAVDAVSHVVYYTHLGSKLYKYYSTGTLVAKMQKIGLHYGSFGLWISDLFEFAATDFELPQDQSQWSYSDSFKKTVKELLPNYNGNLPENATYYAGKDSVAAIGWGLMGLNPVTVGLAYGGTTAWNCFLGKYVDDALVAITLNYRYHSKQPQTQNTRKTQEASITNLKYYLQDSYIPTSADTKMKKKGRALYWEHCIAELENQEKTEAILNATSLCFHKSTCTFLQSGIEVMESINVLFKRFNAILMHSSENGEYCIEYYEPIVVELGKLEAYFEQRLNEMPKDEQEKCQEFFSSLLTTIQKVRYAHRINYLEKTGKLDQLIQETELTWDVWLNSCKVQNRDTTVEEFLCTFLQTTGIEVMESIDVLFKRFNAILMYSSKNRENCIEYYEPTLIELGRLEAYFTRRLNEMPKDEQEKNQKLFTTVLTTLQNVRYTHRINYLEKTGKLEQLIKETELAWDTWDTGLTSCKFQNTDIKIEECLGVVFKRFHALHQKACKETGKAKETILQALNESEKIAKYLWFPKYYEERAELKNNLPTSFISCYCVLLLKGELVNQTNAWEAIQMFDRIHADSRDVLHWFTLGRTLGKMIESYKFKCNERTLSALMSIQSVCFEIIVNLLNKKKETNEKLSDFEAQLYMNASMVVKELKKALPGEKGYSDFITADTRASFYSLIKYLLIDQGIK